MLNKHNNKAPVMLSSSIQATLIGRYGESDYGKSKLAGEELFFKYGEENGLTLMHLRLILYLILVKQDTTQLHLFLE